MFQGCFIVFAIFTGLSMASFFALKLGVRSLFSFFLGDENERDTENEDAHENVDREERDARKQKNEIFKEKGKTLRDARDKFFDEGEPPPEKVFLFFFFCICFCCKSKPIFLVLFFVQVLEHLLKFVSALGIEMTSQNCMDLKQCVGERRPKVLTYDNVDMCVVLFRNQFYALVVRFT